MSSNASGAKLKPTTRPVKRGAAKRQRRQAQKRRLLALGVSEAEIARLNSKQLRTLLKRPAALQKKAAKAAAGPTT